DKTLRRTLFFENKTCQKQRHGISPVTQYQSNTHQRGFKT
ncbi:hypothetical protein LTSEWAN_2516, partial [Salmonella enterica subsp. enterica serovar Wandsworth str. A4-580]